MIYTDNYNLSKQLDKFYNSFQNNISYYNELLKYIYQIYFSENIFIQVNENVKYQLNSIINLIINHYNLTYYISENSEDQELINYLLYIRENLKPSLNFMYNPEIKMDFENFLFQKKLISQQDIAKSLNVYKLINFTFNNLDIKNFFENYGIDFSKEILNINGTKIPNFSLYFKNNMIDHEYEFFHLLFKIYAPVLYYGSSFQEGYEYKINEKDIVFDCGGNMGLFALYCASKGATVYCFEPMSYIRDFLLISQKLYPNKIHIIPYGLSNKNEEVIFTQGFNPGASNNINLNLDTSPQIYKERCKLITLDDFCLKNNIIPTFIKADIEGAEKLMLEGCQNIITKYKPILHICLNHREMDKYTISSQIYKINNNYTFFNFIEGDVRSQFVLCK